MSKNNSIDKLFYFKSIYKSNFVVKTITLTILFLAQATLFFGKQISVSQSLIIAQNFYQSHRNSNLQKVKSAITPTFSLDYIGTNSPKSQRVKALVPDTTAYYYVYNISNNQGFIIVSGDDATKPILAYSNETQFPTTNIPSNVQYWLNFYKSEIIYAQQNQLSASLLDTTAMSKANSVASSVIVQPLLGNIKWDESNPYNLLCPFNSTDNARSVTGCVATAMAQLMKYYQWPVKGTGSFSYTDVNNGTLSANFGNTTYNWANMLETYNTLSSTSKQDSAVATLMYQCGVAVSMTYSPSGSSAAVSNAALALRNYFGYDTDINIYTRDFYNSLDWKTMIKTELNSSRPVLYGGTNGTEGHAFIADGYDGNDLFHINWGWSGYYNGYFELSVLNPPPSGSNGTTGGFSQSQQIVTGIKKPDGLNSASYLINMYSLGLTSTKSTLSNITSQSFNVSFGFLNYGVTDFNGKFGIGLYKDGVFQKTLSTYSSNLSLLSNYGTPSFTLSGLSLAGLAAGTYKIYCIFEPSTASSWTIMKGSNLLNNYLDVVITGSTATISKPSLSPVLTLTQPITISGKAYQNKTALFNVTVQNTGNEFYSNMGIKLYSTTNSSVYQYINYGVVSVATGETKTFTFSGTVSCAPGSYYAVAVCDSLNSFSTTSFKVMNPAANNKVAITVLSQPAAAALSLNSSIALAGSTTITQNEPITLNANVTNTGGYFDGSLIAFVFPAGGSSSISYLDPKTVYIETNQTQAIGFTGSLDLNPGSYSFKLYYNSGSWVGFTPSALATLNFSIIPQVTTNNSELSSATYSIYPNPVKDNFTLKGLSKVATVTISDINGQTLLKKQVNVDEAVSVTSLPKGMYIITILNEEGSVNVKMLKK